MFPATFPSGEGTDLAGVVRAVGDGVDAFAPGDEVLGWSWDRSSHAEAVVVPAGQLVAKPAGLPWPVAGSLGVAGTTAWAAVAAVRPAPGDTVVVSAAAGGVGCLVVQLAVERGATVVGIASPANHAWLREHGAVPVAYGDGLAGRIHEVAPEGVDAFIDLFGPDYVALAVELGVDPDRIETIISFEAAARIGAHAEGSAEATTTEVLAELAGKLATGALELPVAATYPLNRVREAFADLQERHTRGKIVLVP
jgi:NADPH:quinone reductase-like Zn-dependent oxidoreductase